MSNTSLLIAVIMIIAISIIGSILILVHILKQKNSETTHSEQAQVSQGSEPETGTTPYSRQNIILSILFVITALGVKFFIFKTFFPPDTLIYFIGFIVFFPASKELCKSKTPFFIRLMILIFFGMYIGIFVLRVQRAFLPIIFFTVSSCFVLMAMGFFRQEKGIQRNCTVRTVATVIGNQVEKMRNRRSGEYDFTVDTYHPVLCYYVNGEKKEQVYPHGLVSPMEKGRQMEILYNPQKPEEFYFMDSGAQNNSMVVGYLFLIIGILIGIGCVCFVIWSY